MSLEKWALVIACWGALTGTIAIGKDMWVFLFRSGPSLRVSTAYIVCDNLEEEVAVTVRCRGPVPTTVTRLVGSLTSRIRDGESFEFEHSELPCEMKQGSEEEWLMNIADIVAKYGYGREYWFGVKHSQDDKPLLAKTKIPAPQAPVLKDE